jgi:hypothetical protein
MDKRAHTSGTDIRMLDQIPDCVKMLARVMTLFPPLCKKIRGGIGPEREFSSIYRDVKVLIKEP